MCVCEVEIDPCCSLLASATVVYMWADVKHFTEIVKETVKGAPARP